MSLKNANYLDFNAGAALHPNAVKALRLFFSEFPDSDRPILPNPSSIHSHGRLAKRWLAESREQIAHSLGKSVDPEQLIFTSSGTEANQLAIRSVFERRLIKGERLHWITTPVEHDSVMQMQNWILERGGEVSVLPVDSNGAPKIEYLAELWRPETALVSMLWVNNETGVISSVEEAIAFVKAKGGQIHLDAAQAWGKLPIDLEALGAHRVTFSGYKVGGLPGTGVLWLNKGVRADAVILGKQEKGRRGGTENLTGLISLGAAAQSLNPVKRLVIWGKALFHLWALSRSWAQWVCWWVVRKFCVKAKNPWATLHLRVPSWQQLRLRFGRFGLTADFPFQYSSLVF